MRDRLRSWPYKKGMPIRASAGAIAKSPKRMTANRLCEFCGLFQYKTGQDYSWKDWLHRPRHRSRARFFRWGYTGGARRAGCCLISDPTSRLNLVTKGRLPNPPFMRETPWFALRRSIQKHKMEICIRTPFGFMLPNVSGGTVNLIPNRASWPQDLSSNDEKSPWCC